MEGTAGNLDDLPDSAVAPVSTPSPSSAPVYGADLTALQKLLYGVGGLSSGIKGRALGVYVIPFYVEILGLSAALAGTAIMIARVWDAISDPIIGQWTDRTRHPEGRRRIFLKRVAIPYGIVSFLFWAMPEGLSQMQMAVYLGLAYVGLYTFSTLFTVPYYALGAEISEDYDQRTSIAGYRQVFTELGAMLGVLLPAFLIYGAGDDTAAFGMTQKTAWLWMGVLFGVLMFLSAYVPYRTTKEPPPRSAVQPPITEAIKTSLRNKPFVILLIASFIMNFGWAIVGGLVFIVVKYMLGQGEYFKYFMLTQIVAGLASVPIWLRLSAWTGKVWSYRVTQIMQALIFLGAYWMTSDTLWATYLLFIVAGASMAGGGICSAALMADIADMDELETGHRREGMFFAAQWFLTKFPSALGAACAGFILAFAQFDSDLPVQSDWTMENMRFWFGLFVALTQGVGALIVAYFPLTRERHREIRRQLDERRNQAHQDALAAGA